MGGCVFGHYTMARAAAVVVAALFVFAPGAAADCCRQSDLLCYTQAILTQEDDIQGECGALYNERDGCWRDTADNDDLLIIASDRVCFGSDDDCCEQNPWFIVLWIGMTALLIYSCIVCCCIPGACCNKNPYDDRGQPTGNTALCGLCKEMTCCISNPRHNNGEIKMKELRKDGDDVLYAAANMR